MTPLRLLLLLSALAGLAGLSGCASTRSVGIDRPQLSVLAAWPAAERIRWPGDYEPDRAVFHVYNEIEVRAPAAKVWDLLVEAEAWPTWYEGAADLKLTDPRGGRLAPDAVFTWRTMGLELESRVKEFEPGARLAWESRKPVIRGYHAWLLIPTDTGCRVVTAESFHGLLGYLQRIFVPKRLHRLHETWLRELKRRAEGAPTPGVSP